LNSFEGEEENSEAEPSARKTFAPAQSRFKALNTQSAQDDSF